MPQAKNELHLFVIWHSALHKSQEIIEDIAKHLKILECYDMKWDKFLEARNFTRFYGVKLGNTSRKVHQCGGGNFLLLTVLDENPVYEYLETSRGTEYVNTTMFSLKEKYRLWTGGGSRVHATNSPKEADHDLVLLLGKNSKDYLFDAPDKWDGTVIKLKRNISGANGWKNLEELFYVLNSTCNYVVLRNYEILPQQFSSELHGDIDLLAENYEEISLLTNAKKVHRKKYRVHNKVKVCGRFVYFDFRYIGDNYYCRRFEEDILQSRILNKNNIYIPSVEYAFFSLVYHSLIHKNQIAADYYEKTENLYNELYKNKQKLENQFDIYYLKLLSFMQENNYFFVKPIDYSVFYNEHIIQYEQVKRKIEKEFPLTDLKPYMVDCAIYSVCHYFTGYYKGQKLFIKANGLFDTLKNEYKKMKLLYLKNNSNFRRPYFYKVDNNCNFAAFEFIEGERLDKLLESGDLTDTEKNNIVLQLEEIAKTFKECGLIHRDLRLTNFIYTTDKKIEVIDLQYCTSFIKYKEPKIIRKYPTVIKRLGNGYSPGKFKWDDFYSLNKIVKEIGGESSYIKENIGKYNIDFKKRYPFRTIIMREPDFGDERLIFHIFFIKIKIKKFSNN